MPYQQGYIPPGYEGYGAYGQQPSQGQMYQRDERQNPQHPMVVIPQQPRHVVQQSPQYQSTSPHAYSPQAGQLGQAPAQHPQGYQPPYRPAQPQQSLAQVLQQSPYQQQQYYRPQAVQYTPSQGYYQASDSHAQPASSYAQPARQPQVSYQQQQQPRSQYRSTPQQPSAQTRPSPSVQSARPSQPAHQASRTPSRPPPASQVPQQRTVAHVQIPVQRATVALSDIEMPREAKRRRSNDGDAISVCDPPIPQKSSASHRLKQAPVTSSALTELASSQIPPTPPPNVDYQAVLLALADDYVSAAYSMSASITSTDEISEQLEEYHGLMSTGMGCLESVLKNYRQPDARKEARIRFRLATLLYDETENIMEVEEVLSKGIALCERSRLNDLKYAMHHLSARVMFRTSPKAAVKAVEKLIVEVEALRLGHWVYAFRFLRVSLGLQMSGYSDTAAVLKNLASIAATADEIKHVAVHIVASTLEAMVHLRSGAPDSMELAQRALAAARTHQLSQEMQRMPQIRALLDCLDVTCAIIQFSPDQIGAKLVQMQADMDVVAKATGWAKDGGFTVPLGVAANENLTGDTGGIMGSSENGEAALTFTWITNNQLYQLGYLLSGVSSMHKDILDQKARSYLDAGLKLSNVAPGASLQSLAATTARSEWQAYLGMTLRIHQIFMSCGNAQWTEALQALRDINKDLVDVNQPTNDYSKAMLVYLEGMCKQGLGDLKGSLASYSKPDLTFQAGSKVVNGVRDGQALATLNSILILRSMNNEQQADILHAKVESYCLTHGNKALIAAYYIVKATAEANSAIIKRKQYLQSAVQAAQAVKNQHLLMVVLNCMTDMFFRNIVGEQATKSAGAGRSLAYKTHNTLWQAVSNRMYGDTSELCGDHEKATVARYQANQAMQALSPELKKRFTEGAS